MTTTSNLGSQINNEFLLQVLRTRLNDTQRIIATGKKSDTIAELGSQGASNAISFRAKIDTLSGYTSNLNTAKPKLTVMDQAMNSIADDARSALNTLRSQLQGSTPSATILSGEATSKLQQVISQLNVQVNGQYQFSGDDLYNAPLSNASTLDTNIGGLISGFLSGSPTASSVVSAARGVSGTNLGFSSTALSSGNVSFRADDNLDVDYTVRASQQGFADVLRGLSLIKNLPQPTTPTEQTNYWTVVSGAMQLLDEGSRAIDLYQGTLGTKAKLVDELLTQHREATGDYEIFVGNIEDADVAAAATQLQSLQSQLQASYSIIAQLKDLSLVNYL